MRTVIASYLAALKNFIAESLESRLTASDEESSFNQLALTLFAFQFDHVDAYRRVCLARGADPSIVRHWTDIPVVPVAVFKELEMTSLPVGRRPFVFHSSGTTQNLPSHHFHDRESLSLYEISIWSWFRAHLLGDAPASLDLLSLTPPASAAPNSSLVHMVETVRERLRARSTNRLGGEPVNGTGDSPGPSVSHGLPQDGTAVFAGSVNEEGAWHLRPEVCLESLQSSVASRRPLLILGTAFNFVHLIELLNARRIRVNLPPGSRVMETGGYKGRTRSIPAAELHQLISGQLGVPDDWIVSEYGMSELSSQAYNHTAGVTDRAAEPTFRFPPWARARIVSPETGLAVAEGDPGLIQIFDLANVRSVLAIQTDDLGIGRQGGFELLGRAVRAEPRGCSLQSV